MTQYTICFDFPETDDPWFASLGRDGLGFADSLNAAFRLPSQDAAERVLANGYGDGARPYGVVVEVGSA